MKPEGSLPLLQVPATCPCSESDQSSPCPQPTSQRFILILLSRRRQGLPSGLFPSDFPAKTLYTLLLTPIRATRPTHIILLELITRKMFGEDCISFGPSLCSFLHSLLPRPSKGKIFSSAPYSGTPSTYVPP